MQVMISLCFFNNFRKIQRNEVKIFSRKWTGLWKVAGYEEPRLKLSNMQLNKLKSALKNKTGTIIGITKKAFKMKNCHMDYFQQQDKRPK